jgi:gamma-glutamylcyclotransferase
MRLSYKYSPTLHFLFTPLFSTTATPLTTNIMSPKTLYFAYGSNLSLAQMASRCPASTYHALAALRGWKWIVGERGYANVVPSPGQTYTFALRGKPQPPGEENEGEEDYVIGMLYYLEDEDEAKLDRAEGVPYAYVKEMLGVELLGEGRKGIGEKVEALVYVDRQRTGDGICKEEYVARMNRGIRDSVAKGMQVDYGECFFWF